MDELKFHLRSMRFDQFLEFVKNYLDNVQATLRIIIDELLSAEFNCNVEQPSTSAQSSTHRR